jgi:hypothetical protein
MYFERSAHMKDNKSGWQFPKALEIIKCNVSNCGRMVVIE